MHWQTGLLVVLLLIVLLFLVFRLKLHWLWDLGFFLFFVILFGVLLMNQHGGMREQHWSAICILVLGYVALVMFAGAVCAIRTYTESVPEMMKRLDAIQAKLDNNKFSATYVPPSLSSGGATPTLPAPNKPVESNTERNP